MIIYPSPGKSQEAILEMLQRARAMMGGCPVESPPSKEVVAKRIAKAKRLEDVDSHWIPKPTTIDKLAEELLHVLQNLRQDDGTGSRTAADNAEAPATTQRESSEKAFGNRPDFEKALASGIALANAISTKHADDGRVDAVLRQLQAIQTWAADGSMPTRKQAEGMPIFEIVMMLGDCRWPTIEGGYDLADALLDVWAYVLRTSRDASDRPSASQEHRDDHARPGRAAVA